MIYVYIAIVLVIDNTDIVYIYILYIDIFEKHMYTWNILLKFGGSRCVYIHTDSNKTFHDAYVYRYTYRYIHIFVLVASI